MELYRSKYSDKKSLEEDAKETMHVVLLEIPEMTDETLEMTDTLEVEENLQQ